MLWIACHDAGGAEIVSAWARKNADLSQTSFVLEGPAVSIFQRKFSDLTVLKRDVLAQINPSTDWVLTGTGWSSDLERFAISIGRKGGCKVSSYLDHWTNFSKRFKSKMGDELPDEIWVGDKYAFEIAKKEFDPKKIRLVENLYFTEMRAEIKKLQETLSERKATDGLRILYICEAVSEHFPPPPGLESVEFRALKRFLKWLESEIAPDQVAEIRLRSHPAEQPNKYDSFVHEHPSYSWGRSTGTTLAADCAWSDWVAGMNSAALVVTLLAGKPTISCLAIEGEKTILPFSELQCI